MAIFYQYRPYPTGITIGCGKNEKSTKFCLKKIIWKTLIPRGQLQLFSVIHSPSVNSFFNVFLLFFCFYFIFDIIFMYCRGELANWYEMVVGYWIWVTITFCELSVNFVSYYCSFEKLRQTLHKKRGNWSQTASCTCFWDGYWTCASHHYWSIFLHH